MSAIDDCLALLQGNELESSLRRKNMNIHEAVLLPLMIKEIFNIQISACQVINKEQACRNMEIELRKIGESQPEQQRQHKISQTR